MFLNFSLCKIFFHEMLLFIPGLCPFFIAKMFLTQILVNVISFRFHAWFDALMCDAIMFDVLYDCY